VLAFAASNAFAEPFHVEFPAHFGDSPPTTTQCEAAIQIACYGPLQYEQAYNMKPLYNAGLTGAGKTIVIVGSGRPPSGDLTTFDEATACRRPVVQHHHATVLPSQRDPAAPAGGVETSLDVGTPPWLRRQHPAGGDAGRQTEASRDSGIVAPGTS
jgi:hypothetical protein